MYKKLSIALTAMTFYLATEAQTIETNVPNIVVKNYQCYLDGKWLKGNLVNRNSDQFKGKIRVKIIDPENDILWQGAKSATIDGSNGANFDINIIVGTCQSPNKVQITLEP